MLTIGEFSRLCFATKKTLRHYDEIGLLRPEYVAENGYRYYTVAQLNTMRLIARLKGYGFSLPEVAAALADPAPDALARRLLEKRAQMQAGLQQTQRALAQLDRDVDKLKRRMDIMSQNIEVTTAQCPPMHLYGVRDKISVRDFQELFARLYGGIAQNGIQPLGPPMAFYHEEDFNPENSDIEVAVPVAEGTPGAHLLPGGLCCVTTLSGPYDPDAFTAAYAGLMEWIEQNGHRLTGAPYDRYVRGGEGVDPKDYLTEIYFPIA